MADSRCVGVEPLTEGSWLSGWIIALPLPARREIGAIRPRRRPCQSHRGISSRLTGTWKRSQSTVMLCVLHGDLRRTGPGLPGTQQHVPLAGGRAWRSLASAAPSHLEAVPGIDPCGRHAGSGSRARSWLWASSVRGASWSESTWRSGATRRRFATPWRPVGPAGPSTRSRRWLHAQPSSAEAHALKAEVALAEGDFPEVKREFNEARSLGYPDEKLDRIQRDLGCASGPVRRGGADPDALFEQLGEDGPRRR